MTLKHAILCSIITVLTAALFFCFGMQHAVTHLSIQTDVYGDSAIVTLHGQAHLYGINGYTIDGETQCPIDLSNPQ